MNKRMISSRQFSKHVVVELTPKSKFDSLNEPTSATLPAGALVVAATLVVQKAFVSADVVTASIFDLGGNSFFSTVDIKTTGAKTAANFPLFYPNGGTILFVVEAGGLSPPSGGSAIAHIEYVLLGAENEIQDFAPPPAPGGGGGGGGGGGQV